MTDFIKNWLAQHIKNTDFTYKGLLPEVHPIPNPFKWNAFFAVYYPEMDEEHKALFSCLAEVYQHINKHNTFLVAMRGLTTPVGQEWIDFAKNWLSQHIPNTDFRYKNMMPYPVADPYV